MADVAKVVLPATPTAYSLFKDIFLCMNKKANYVKNLEVNLVKIIGELVTFNSRKDEIDDHLKTYMSEERNDVYYFLVTQIENHLMRCNEFLDKYNKYRKNLPILDVNDISSANNVINALQNRKSIILTHKFFKLAKLSKEINELFDHISQVTGKMRQENVLRKKKIEVVQVVQRDDVDLPSSTEYVEKILSCLRKDDNKSVGVLGLIGVGKTTIMKRLKNQLNHSKNLDVVIWIDYEEHHVKEKNIEVIQDAIMERLKLDQVKTDRIEQNASIISTALEDKRYILLIDKVSSSFSFNEVGIHKGHKCGKVVIASRSKKVISPMIDDHVQIQPLSDNEALALFREVYGTIKSQRIKSIQKAIVKSCGGLPLVIKLVAQYLKGAEDDQVWSHVKQVLQSETEASNLLKLAEIGQAYRLVYDKLGESDKKCLLFVTLFPSDYKICKDYLVECWNAERYLKDNQGLRSARNHGATVLRELTNQYLLENHSAKHVKLPVYFRKVAIELEYPGEKNCLSWVPEKIQSLTKDPWKNTKRMSLICGKSKLPGKSKRMSLICGKSKLPESPESHNKLPESPESHNMSTLLMQRNPNLVALGDQFFSNMQNLCILDLHLTMIESLPSSITSLASLICLYLNDCPQLVKLPPEIRTLEKLELLDIRGTSIPSLPIEIGHMYHLKCLRITFDQKGCNQNRKKRVGTMITSGIIGCLCQLEELTIEVGCCSQDWTDIVDKIVIELTCLKRLSTLNFHFPGVSSVKNFVTNTNTFRSFNISVGCCEMQHPYDLDVSEISSAERKLRFSDRQVPTKEEEEEEEISSVGEVLRGASSLELVSHSGVRSLSDFNLNNFGNLKVCVVKCCNKMMSVVDVPEINEMQIVGVPEINEMQTDKENDDCAILSCLEKLYLFDLPLLQSIWKGPVFSGSFVNLKVLTLVDCPLLTEILTGEQAKALSSLEHMKVENCPEVVEIIKEVSEDINPSDILNKVMTIEFGNLSGLQHICRNTSIKWRSLVKIAIIRCNRLRDLQMTLSNAENLEEIKCEESLWTALQFPEKQLFRLRCDSINAEQNPAIQVYYKGESSGSGIPNNHLPNVIVSGNDGQEMERNGKNLLTPNIEQNPAIQLYYKGESSRSGIQNNHLPSNVIVSGNDGQEMERNGKNLLTPNIEQNPATQLYYKGESSRSGIPNNHLPSNVIVSGNDGQEMERNGKNLTPNTNYGDRVDDHKEEITYHQDAPESSQQDRIIPQSTNTNGALSIPEEKSSKTVHCCFWILTVRKK